MVELMLSVAIMGIIIFALYSVFNQTQRALRNTETQGDVAEKGRAIVEIISRELQQAKATFGVRPGVNGGPYLLERNMLGGCEYPPLVQKSDRADIQARTNFFHNLFFISNHTNAWQATGYRVVNITNGVGVLVRYETNLFGSRPSGNIMSQRFIDEPITNVTFHHVADGVIHMAFIPYDRSGNRLGFDTTNRIPDQFKIYRANNSGNLFPAPLSDVSSNYQATVVLTEGYPSARAETLPYATSFQFRSNALPAAIDMEFGILEPETLSQYYLMKREQNPNATNFLARQVSKVHLFRQRIPIRTGTQ